MYCPMVAISPSLCWSVPSDALPIMCRKSGIDVKFSELIEIRECCFKGFMWYC